MPDTLTQTELDTEAELNEIITGLDALDGKYPRAAIASARRRRDAIVPRMIQSIDDAVAEVKATGEVKGNAAFFSLPLLSEFHAAEALPSVLRALACSSDELDEIFGDQITECLSQELADLGVSPEILDQLIVDPSLVIYVRSSAMSAYMQLVFDGRLSRTQALERLRQHLIRMIGASDSEGISWLVSALYDYSPHEALPEILQAFQSQLVQEYLIDLPYLQNSLNQGHRGEFGQSLCDIGLDREVAVVDELEDWYSFQEKPASTHAKSTTVPAPHSPTRAPFESHWRPDVDTIRYDKAKIGRNDPCPCGSGKKFKKCCGTH